MARVEYVYDDMDMKTLLWKWPTGRIGATEETRQWFIDLHISSKARVVWKCREEDYKTTRAIKEIQAIFFQPIQISQDSDNVIHYVKYPKRARIWERERALIFQASLDHNQVEKRCF